LNAQYSGLGVSLYFIAIFPLEILHVPGVVKSSGLTLLNVPSLENVVVELEVTNICPLISETERL